MNDSKADLLKPIFLFSLPRSGSTLLQRIMMSHSKISSTAEPWILLPLVYMSRKGGSVSEYSAETSREAIEDLKSGMAGGIGSYSLKLRGFVDSIYQSLSTEGDIYFLDKTPRYYLIIKDIAELFPDAKFIFLFRNPVQVYASILSTFGGFKALYANAIDLESGPVLLSEGYEFLKNRAIGIRYEDFVIDPLQELKRIADYLSIDIEPEMLTKFHQQAMPGRMGDPTGVNEYVEVSRQSMDKWRAVFNSGFRKKVLTNYINKLSEETLAIQGYSKQAILDEVSANPIERFTTFEDGYYYCRSGIIKRLHANLYFSRRMAWAKKRHLS